ncbi:hypothetical protein Dsin_012020 [Dipteronia sinensis]|uniref:DUF4283 domain-containing protein n=1 Tax=Dipteronia sinensis TaxID=43782 RepID=A0AAE0E913_9ROSI|nr:hypothetical protein Dsin_012020 [Dipteronia sinensis]
MSCHEKKLDGVSKIEVPLVEFTGKSTGSQTPPSKVEEDNGEDAPSMFWTRQHNVEDWLPTCAIGVLKKFSSVSSVCRRLTNRGFSFSTSYLGNKNILWCFESEIEKEGFMSNKFFWEDCFTSMSRWTDSWTTSRKLVWINVYGTPLSCWEDLFFMELGSQIGTPLCVAKETSSKKRLDRGKVLVIIHSDRKKVSQINNSLEKKTFVVKQEVHPEPVSLKWLNQFLGLNDNSGASPKSSFRLRPRPTNEAGPITKVMTDEEDKGQLFRGFRRSHSWSSNQIKKGKATSDKVVSEVNCFSYKFASGGKGKVDKGKRMWVRKSKDRKFPAYYGNTKLYIGKKKGHPTKLSSQKAHSSLSSESDSSTDEFFKSHLLKGNALKGKSC